jgi:hypothetical protein
MFVSAEENNEKCEAVAEFLNFSSFDDEDLTIKEEKCKNSPTDAQFSLFSPAETNIFPTKSRSGF